MIDVFLGLMLAGVGAAGTVCWMRWSERILTDHGYVKRQADRAETEVHRVGQQVEALRRDVDAINRRSL